MNYIAMSCHYLNIKYRTKYTLVDFEGNAYDEMKYV